MLASNHRLASVICAVVSPAACGACIPGETGATYGVPVRIMYSASGIALCMRMKVQKKKKMLLMGVSTKLCIYRLRSKVDVKITKLTYESDTWCQVATMAVELPLGNASLGTSGSNLLKLLIPI